MLDNQTFINFCQEYQKTRDERLLLKHFLLMKPYLKLGLYHDPTGTLNEDDFESIAFLGFWQATLLFDETKSSKVFAWLFYLVRQRILGEITKRHRESKFSINSHQNPDQDLDELDFLSVQKEEKYELLFEKEVRVLHEEIMKISPKAAKVFELRLAYPYISRKSIAVILNFKRRNGIAKLVKIIKACANKYLSQEIRSTLLR